MKKATLEEVVDDHLVEVESDNENTDVVDTEVSETRQEGSFGAPFDYRYWVLENKVRLKNL